MTYRYPTHLKTFDEELWLAKNHCTICMQSMLYLYLIRSTYISSNSFEHAAVAYNGLNLNITVYTLLRMWC